MTKLFRCAVGVLISMAFVVPVRAQQNPGPFPPAPRPQQAQPAQPAVAPVQPATSPVVPAQSATPPAEAVPLQDSPARAIVSSNRPERDMSPWTMFMAADILVKAVMISLTFASLVTWTIFLAKSVQLGVARRRLTTALKRLANAPTLAQAQVALGTQRGVLAEFLATAIQEIRLSSDNIVDSGVKERVASRLLEITKIESRSVRQGMSVLATIGSTAPFVGLFGTVWGIMNSFIGISKAQTTNLAVVAPGIAEALLATAIGLVAAIPAVMIYNHFSRATKGYVDLVGRGSGEVGRILSRDLDRAQSRMLSRAAE